jgi:hypothetical protein
METMKYNLQDFMNISFNGFDFVIPEDTMKLISSLSMEVGSPTYIKTPIFQKKEQSRENVFTNGSSGIHTNFNSSNSLFKPFNNKRRRGNKNMEINSEDWETLRTFQVTKIEHKTGVDGQIDQIRALLNKLTDKTFKDICEKIKQTINEFIEDGLIDEDFTKIGTSIFELASTNKFYSKIYADLYADLIQTHDFLKPIFDKNYESYLELFKTIEYVDPDVNYDRFCEINKINEKRKAISMFFVNLSTNNIVTKTSIAHILRNLLMNVLTYIHESNKKDEVDEITENIAILYKEEIIKETIETPELLIDGKQITQIIMELAKSKSKDYKSLSNKAIFKYMDLVDM